MIRTLSPKRGSLVFIVGGLVLAMVVTVGCKKKPTQTASTPEPPQVESQPPAEEVQETQPMKPVVREDPAPARAMGADHYNREGVLKTIYFDFDKHEIRPDQRATLRANADWLKGQSFVVVIEGYCDERGTSEYNMVLGDKRANATREYLISLGIPASRIRTVSYGEERPADPGHNESAWAKNRRSEFLLQEG